MIVLRVRDHRGDQITEFDAWFSTASGRPDSLPRGASCDRQRNPDTGIVTFYLDYDALVGKAPIQTSKERANDQVHGTQVLGLEIHPRPTSGFAHFVSAVYPPSAKLLALVRPNETLMVDVVLRRMVRENIFRLHHGLETERFEDVRPGLPIEFVVPEQ